jgi:hypothetical protein
VALVRWWGEFCRVMALFPLGLKGNLSPLGLNPSSRRVERPPLWVHTLNAATHRLSLERLAMPSPGLSVLPHAVILHPSEPLLGLTTATHSMRLYRSEPGNDDPC